jgi:hypothetical protein
MKWFLRLWLLAMGLVFLLGLVLVCLILFTVSMLKWVLTGRRPNINLAVNSYQRWARKAPLWTQHHGPAGGEIIDAEAKVVQEGTPCLTSSRNKGHGPE